MAKGKPSSKKTAHPWADEIVSSPKAYMKRLADKHGADYVSDWLAVHKEETRWARSLLASGDFNCLDTETTSTSAVAEVAEIAIVDRYGQEQFNSLIRPSDSGMSGYATTITGIDANTLRKAPLLSRMHAPIQKALTSKPVVLIYNAEFDVRIIEQSCFHAGLPPFNWPEVVDLMKHFSRWVGDWNPKQNDYSWLRLEGGHRARGDCLAMISLMEKMARVPQSNQEWNPTRPK